MMDEMREIFIELMDENESEIVELEVEKKKKYIEFTQADMLIDKKVIKIMEKEIELYNDLIMELEKLSKDDENKEKRKYKARLKKFENIVDELEMRLYDTRMEIEEKQEIIKRDKKLIKEMKKEMIRITPK